MNTTTIEVNRQIRIKTTAATLASAAEAEVGSFEDNGCEPLGAAVAVGVRIEQPTATGAVRFQCDDIAAVVHTDCYLSLAQLERVSVDWDRLFCQIAGQQVNSLRWACFTATGEIWGVR
ncbi:MAG: hypothetical protein P8N94_02535 [Gammaproteobacteria bacterium]|nr:hypothetical protein [Gammaproteobacteria bacterium]